MTDKEIIKALECCNKDDCDNCPYKRNCKNVMCDVLDLINRQQTEIERLKKELQITRDAYIMLQTKNEIAKSEAVKEFAEYIKRYIDVGHLRPPTETCFSELDVVRMIDKLVKEMESES